jgi:protein TonB
MSLEPGKVSDEILKEGFGSLGGCLMDGDADQRRRQQSIRRRSLAISVAVESAILTAFILVSLFGKPQSIALASVTPVPPFGQRARHLPANPKPPTPRPPVPGRYTIFHPLDPRPIARTGESPNPVGPADPLNRSTDGAGCDRCVGLDPRDDTRRPEPPPPEVIVKAQVVHVTRLDPAMLIHRVEPVYPPLAKQIHREGRVELRATIGTDGTIRSLETVSGDPIFLRSALEAVEQWLYKPTILNGQPVEIDTYITVVYTMQH